MSLAQWGQEDADQVFAELAMTIKRQFPGFEIKFKNQSLWQKLIGKLAFFNKQYMTSYTSTFGDKVFFPSSEFVEEHKKRSFKILAHEYIHMLDNAKYSILFQVAYTFPQCLSLLGPIAGLVLWLTLGPWWALLGVLFLVALGPWPAPGRAALEQRAYAMNIAINLWCHGSLLKETKEGYTETFTGWGYYKMGPDKEGVSEWVDEIEALVRAVDTVNPDATIFDLSPAFQEVYEIITGVILDPFEDDV